MSAHRMLKLTKKIIDKNSFNGLKRTIKTRGATNPDFVEEQILTSYKLKKINDNEKEFLLKHLSDFFANAYTKQGEKSLDEEIYDIDDKELKEDFKEVTYEEFNLLLAKWYKDHDAVEKTCFLAEYKDGTYVAGDNMSGDFYVEDFKNRNDAIKWIENPEMTAEEIRGEESFDEEQSASTEEQPRVDEVDEHISDNKNKKWELTDLQEKQLKNILSKLDKFDLFSLAYGMDGGGLNAYDDLDDVPEEDLYDDALDELVGMKDINKINKALKEIGAKTLTVNQIKDDSLDEIPEKINFKEHDINWIRKEDINKKSNVEKSNVEKLEDAIEEEKELIVDFEMFCEHLDTDESILSPGNIAEYQKDQIYYDTLIMENLDQFLYDSGYETIESYKFEVLDGNGKYTPYIRVFDIIYEKSDEDYTEEEIESYDDIDEHIGDAASEKINLKEYGINWISANESNDVEKLEDADSVDKDEFIKEFITHWGTTEEYAEKAWETIEERKRKDEDFKKMMKELESEGKFTSYLGEYFKRTFPKLAAKGKEFFEKIKSLFKKKKLSQDSSDDEKTCSLCGKKFIGHGNNPAPLKGETACDKCNLIKVIPARLEQMRNQHASKVKDENTLDVENALKMHIESNIAAEEEAILAYELAIETATAIGDEESVKIFTHIKEEEEHHLKELKAML